MYSASPRLSDLLISDNSAECDGGGLYCMQSSPQLERVRFSANHAGDGAAIYCYFDCHIVLRGCVFEGNTAEHGGAIFCCNDSDLLLQQTTFTLNSALTGGALLLRDNGNAILENCILWDNTPQEVYFYSVQDPNSVEIACSDLTGGEEAIHTSGNGEVSWSSDNIDLDPHFCDPLNNDFRLADDSPCRTDVCGYMGYSAETCEGEGVPDAERAPGSGHPLTIELSQNYPNPFNPVTTIEFRLSGYREVSMVVYNLNGQLVSELADGCFPAGAHRVTFSATTGVGTSTYSLPSGVYLYRLVAGKQVVTRKMVLVR